MYWKPVPLLALLATTSLAIAAASHPRGLYALDDRLHNGSYPDLPSWVHGVTLRIHWRDVQPTDNSSYNWSVIDARIARHSAAGRKVQLGIGPGAGSPHWLYRLGAEQFRMLWNLDYSYKNCSTVPLPLPWCPIFLRNWVAFVTAVGKRYDPNPAVVAVKVCGINGQTMEQVLPFKNVSGCSPQPVDPAEQWAAKGYTPGKIIEAWSTIMDAYGLAFPRTNLILMTGPWGLPGVDANGQVTGHDDTNLTNELTLQFMRKFGVARAGLQDNGLRVWWAWSPPLGLPAETVVGAQTVWYVTGDTTCRMKAHKRPCAPHWTLNATLQRALANREAYVEVYLVDVINPQLADVLIGFAHHYPPLLSTPY